MEPYAGDRKAEVFRTDRLHRPGATEPILVIICVPESCMVADRFMVKVTAESSNLPTLQNAARLAQTAGLAALR